MPSPPARSQDAALAAAYAHCETIARAHYENFPVASRFLPRRCRPHLWAVYAFARTADDFADEPGLAPAERLERLQSWEAALDGCLAGDAEEPIFRALGETIQRCQLSLEPFRRLLEAFRLDVTRDRHADWEALLHYCARSADPIGRIVLGIFGYRDERLLRLSDAICTGLQLANFWQDVAVDLDRGRIYLPDEARRRHGVTEEALRAGRVDPPFRSLMTEMVGRTREFFRRGRTLPGQVGRDLAIHLRLVWLGGATILDRIERVGFDVFRRRPTLRRLDWAGLLARAMLPLPAGAPRAAGGSG